MASHDPGSLCLISVYTPLNLYKFLCSAASVINPMQVPLLCSIGNPKLKKRNQNILAFEHSFLYRLLGHMPQGAGRNQTPYSLSASFYGWIHHKGWRLSDQTPPVQDLAVGGWHQSGDFRFPGLSFLFFTGIVNITFSIKTEIILFGRKFLFCVNYSRKLSVYWGS